MLLRRVARPMFASWFMVEGLDAVRHPAAHAASARDGMAIVRTRLARCAHLSGIERLLDDRHGADLDAVLDRALGDGLSDRQLTTAVRLHGAAMLVAGGMLALGRAPRTSAVALAVLTAPVAAVDVPAGKGGAVTVNSDTGARTRQRRFWTAVSATGGALLAAADHEGRPGLGWRLQNARETRTSIRDAVADATAQD